MLAEGREGSAGDKRKIREMSGTSGEIPRIREKSWNLGKIKVITGLFMGNRIRKIREKSGNWIKEFLKSGN